MRILAAAALVLSACFVQAPPPAQPQQPGGVHVSQDGTEPGPEGPTSGNYATSGELPSGTSAMCRAGDLCNWECENGGCDIACAGGSTCNVECESGGCRLACGEGATCNFECEDGGCDFDCAPGSVCNVDDD